MVLESTVMNVSIEREIEDLGTKVSTMPPAIATYISTTAALHADVHAARGAASSPTVASSSSTDHWS